MLQCAALMVRRSPISKYHDTSIVFMDKTLLGCMLLASFELFFPCLYFFFVPAASAIFLAFAMRIQY